MIFAKWLKPSPGFAFFVMLILNHAGATEISTLPDPSPLASRQWPTDSIISRIAFGSCYVPQFENPAIWKTIAKLQPQLLLMMGDNVYQSEEKAAPELTELREAYAMLAAEKEFSSLRQRTTVLATWDDHDYGLNDAGGELPVKRQSEALFEHVWPIASPDLRKQREGIYHSSIYGKPGQRIQVLMLDTRFFRGAMSDTSASMLGEAQWRWLADELSKPAELRLLVSSIPVLSEWKGGENWNRMPHEQQRLFELIKSKQANGVVLLSGDTHFAAHFSNTDVLPYPLHEFSASSLNYPYPEQKQVSMDWQDGARDGNPIFAENFGFLAVDWVNHVLSVTFYDGKSVVLASKRIKLQDLQRRK